MALSRMNRRHVDDTLVGMPDTDAATELLTTLNGLHSSLTFTMELPGKGMIPFIGTEIISNETKIETQVYRKTGHWTIHWFRAIDYCFRFSFYLLTYVNFLHFLNTDDRMSPKRRNLSALVFLTNSSYFDFHIARHSFRAVSGVV